MCQQHEGESRYLRSHELREIRDAWEKHKSGEKPLTNEQILELAVRKIMLEEG
jgi:dissimilatory sulfite reductase (desulfoviridin) alpha/beta subunit